MRRVIVESPFAGAADAETERNITYGRACLHDCLLRDEAPFASHLLYTQQGVLDDKVSDERKLGIEAGLVWDACAKATVVYEDFGISPGMQTGIERAEKEGRSVEYRKLYIQENR